MLYSEKVMDHFTHPRNVGEMEKIVGLSQSALSQHLAILRSEDIVQTRREAQTIFYSIKSEKVVEILSLLGRLFN